MPDRAEQAEHAMSALMRFVVSLIIPLWALSMLALGVEYRSVWWLGTGLAVGAVGLLLLVGNPAGELRPRRARTLAPLNDASVAAARPRA